jgi:2Fe-2S ferredoxin
MVKIKFITKNNDIILAEGKSGSIMKLAKEYNVKGIDADCGGVCSCATCHVYVDPEYFDKVGTASEIEKDMLELSDNATAFSRLSCQIELDEFLDGMILRVAR